MLECDHKAAQTLEILSLLCSVRSWNEGTLCDLQHEKTFIYIWNLCHILLQVQLVGGKKCQISLKVCFTEFSEPNAAVNVGGWRLLVRGRITGSPNGYPALPFMQPSVQLTPQKKHEGWKCLQIPVQEGFRNMIGLLLNSSGDNTSLCAGLVWTLHKLPNSSSTSAGTRIEPWFFWLLAPNSHRLAGFCLCKVKYCSQGCYCCFH